MNFALDTKDIKTALDALAAVDKDVQAALDLVGYPAERKNPQGFNTVLRVIVGQQLSVKAAASIWGRVQDLAGETATPDDYDRLDDEALRAAGLSRQKVNYVRSLCATVRSGTLDFDALANHSDEDAIKAITAVKGLGVWSAHMYLMFSLGRADIMPVGDLAVRVGIGRIVGLEERPTEKQCDEIGKRWAPNRSVMALLAWHYYSNAPF
jgi:DNA-3-methyladenine glycosylase II